MTNEKLYEILGDINEKHVYEARAYHKAKKPIWAKWGAIAACLVLVCVVAIPLFLHNNDSVTTPGIADAAPMIYVNDTLYKQSTSQTSFNELKDDFVYLGVIESDVTNFQGTNDAGNYLDGIPKENFQANHPIVGAEVYHLTAVLKRYFRSLRRGYYPFRFEQPRFFYFFQFFLQMFLEFSVHSLCIFWLFSFVLNKCTKHRRHVV